MRKCVKPLVMNTFDTITDEDMVNLNKELFNFPKDN